MALFVLVVVSMSNLNSVEFVIWIICLSPIWGTLLWVIWEGSIRPRLIPRHEIIAKADELWEQDQAHAFDIACTKEHIAWYRSNTFEQGRWRRIRREIMRRERALGATFRKVRW